MKSAWVMVDVEADGPAPGLYSMTELGAVIVEPALERTFYANLAPISDEFVPAALAVTGRTREQTLEFTPPEVAMLQFDLWLRRELVDQGIRPMFVSDNNGFDWQFVNYYSWRFTKCNRFGHSSTNLGSLYKGLKRDLRSNFKHLRKTAHTHNPVDDARGNAEAMLTMMEQWLTGIR
jgi:hypothetical protein